MCKNCYEKFIKRTGKIMLMCKFLENESESESDLVRLCTCQRYCNEKDKYMPHHQKEGCKKYED